MTGRGGEQPPFEVDARGMRCPWPVLRAARAMRDHPSILIRADDPMAEAELQALAAERGWSFVQADPAVFQLGRD